MSKKVLIVGGVAGGASAAARLRRVDEHADIILFEKGEYISFANCGLPYYIGETIPSRSSLLVQTPEAMKARFNIDIRVRNEVLSIDREKKKVSVINHASGQKYEETYDTLVLATGSIPMRPPVAGADSPNIFTLWDLPDTDAIKGFVDNLKPARAVIIGAGFIGLEMAENLYERGIQVTLVEMLDQVMVSLDYEIAQHVHLHLRTSGVNLRLGDGVKAFNYHDGVTTVILNSGAQVDADIVLLATGVKPRSELAVMAGLEVNQRGGIVVDSHMRTSDPSIFAVGDVVEVTDFVLGSRTMVPLAGPANKQGRIAADNIAGGSEEYRGTQGTSVAKVFDITVASTGVNEKMLQRTGKKYGVDYRTATIHPNSHANYYPGAQPLTIKLVFDMDGRVLGAQSVGFDGVDKRIDVIATAIRLGAKVGDLEQLELAYAPPFSSAKDPVNMVGFVAGNILRGQLDTIEVAQLDSLDSSDSVLLDVRDAAEREVGYIDGSINIPVNSLRERLGELDKEKEIIVYCAVGLRGYIASRILAQNGFKRVRNLAGGFRTYSHVYCQDPVNKVKCGGYIIGKPAAPAVAAAAPETPSVTMPKSEPERFTDTGETETGEVNETGVVVRLDACGLQCPGPVMQLRKTMEGMKPGDVVDVTATDPGFLNDVVAWASRTGNTLLDSGRGENRTVYARLKKGAAAAQKTRVRDGLPNDKTLVVFSGDLDKAMASLIIANGAVAMGRKVTMFFTFWGLSILRKSNPPKMKKDFMSAMFGWMLPKGAGKLGLSRMNMLGMGPWMMKLIMKKKNVDTVQSLLESALENGVKIIACTMSMDIMGIQKEELIDGIEYSGVATYLGAAEEADTNLFV